MILTPAENCLQSCLRKQFGMAASSGTTIWNWIQILSNVAGHVYVEPFVDLCIKITLTSSIKFKNEKQIADLGLLVRTFSFNLELELGRNCTNHYHVLFFLCLYLCVYSTSTSSITKTKTIYKVISITKSLICMAGTNK